MQIYLWSLHKVSSVIDKDTVCAAKWMNENERQQLKLDWTVKHGNDIATEITRTSSSTFEISSYKCV